MTVSQLSDVVREWGADAVIVHNGSPRRTARRTWRCSRPRASAPSRGRIGRRQTRNSRRRSQPDLRGCDPCGIHRGAGLQTDPAQHGSSIPASQLCDVAELVGGLMPCGLHPAPALFVSSPSPGVIVLFTGVDGQRWASATRSVAPPWISAPSFRSRSVPATVLVRRGRRSWISRGDVRIGRRGSDLPFRR